jgi:tRNA threonylcarbamoyladenosine biosynthesis protein TsaE
MRFKTESDKETRGVAALMVRELRRGAPHPFVIGLSGELGSGKTTFTQGFAVALGVKRRLLSPTFLIMRSYHLPRAVAGYDKIFHLDAYRLRHRSETDVLGLAEILRDPKNIILIEWVENINGALPKNSIAIHFEHGKKENERFIQLMQY